MGAGERDLLRELITIELQKGCEYKRMHDEMEEQFNKILKLLEEAREEKKG